MTKHTKRTLLRKSKSNRNKLRKNKSRKNYKRGGDENTDKIDKFLKEIETYYVNIENAYKNKDEVINGDSFLINGVVVCDYIIEKLSLLIKSHDQKLIKIPGYTAYNPPKKPNDNWIPNEKIMYGIPSTKPFGKLFPKQANDVVRLPESTLISEDYKQKIQKYINYIKLIRDHYAFLLNTELLKILSSIVKNKYGDSISTKDKNSIIYMYYYGVSNCNTDRLFDDNVELIKFVEMPQTTGSINYQIIINSNKANNIDIRNIIQCIKTDNERLISESAKSVNTPDLPDGIRIKKSSFIGNNQDYFIQFFNTKNAELDKTTPNLTSIESK